MSEEPPHDTVPEIAWLMKLVPVQAPLTAVALCWSFAWPLHDTVPLSASGDRAR